MFIHDTVTDFTDNYLPTIDYLKKYYEKHARHFEEYFRFHCHNVDEKMEMAIQKHQEKISALIEIKDKMPMFISDIARDYEQVYDIAFTKDVHLIVGLFGSNAFTYRQIIPEIAFCLEKLSPQDRHLQIIIAHELGHALHHLLSEKRGIDWAIVDWESPFTWLLQEGIATYFSTKMVSARKDEYFAFEEDLEWITFATNNKQIIIEEFLSDLTSLDARAVFFEWFSINGGKRFGFNRLAYFIAYEFIQSCLQELAELDVITLWRDVNYQDVIYQQLSEMVKKNV
ncbi:M3 family metallopeptidase [Lysinibacillus sp. CTST325]